MFNIAIQRKEVFNDQRINKIINILEYSLAIFLILTCNSVYFKSANIADYKIIQLLFLANLFVIAFYSLVATYKQKKNIKVLIKFLTIFTALFLLFCILNNLKYPLGKNFLNYMYVIPALSLCYFHYSFSQERINALWIKLENIMVILAIFSLIFWIIGPTLNLIHFTGYKGISFGGIRGIPSYYNIFFAAQGQVNFFGLNVTRNTAIFCEAPMYAFILSVALFINLYIEKRISFKTIILVITLFSTTSTTGILMAIFALGLKFVIDKRVTGKIPLKLKPYIIAFIGLFSLSLSFVLLHNKIGATSSSIRMNDFYAGFKAWMMQPIMGNGIENTGALKQFMAPSRLLPNGDSGFSTGLMKVLAGGGIYLFSFYVIPMILLLKNYWRKNRELAMFSVLLFVIFTFTIVDSIYLFIMLIMWLWVTAMYKQTVN